MNKIYKLIWSKVKNMWVVANELAKSHTKSPNSGIVGSVSLASLESKINTDLSKGFVAGVFPMATLPAVKSSSFTITVAAIVKNEAGNVPTWVQAARSCADEIVVVDTGSTDDTVERFADYGIKCFHYDWHDDFASAKNYMISLCHSDWIVLLDGDEWFRDGCDVRKAIAKHHGNPVTKAIIADWICLDKDRNNAVMFSGGAVRAFRNQPDVRYFRKVHENLTINYENFAFEPDFKMYHTGYSGSVNRSKHERNLRIMCTMFDFDNGKVEYPTDWRYIEDTYAGLGQFDKALWAADKMISYGVQEYSAAAWITKFNVLFAMKTSLEEMKKQFVYCFKTVPSVSGFWFLASVYFFRNGLIAEGLDNYIEGLRMLMGPQDKVAQEHTYWRMYMPEASALVSAVYLQNKQVEAALYACKVCEQYCGQTDWTNRALAAVRRVLNRTEEGLLGNIMEQVLPVLQFGKRAVLATALVSSLTIGMAGVANPVFAACCNLNGVTTNQTTGDNSTVTGGECNTSSGYASTVTGGSGNIAANFYSSVSGGTNNTASGDNSSVSGGSCNTAGLYYSYIKNSASRYTEYGDDGLPSFVLLEPTFVSPACADIVGDKIRVRNYVGTIDEFDYDTYNGNYATVSGGCNNAAIGDYSSVSGGCCNIASGCTSSISGGVSNVTLGEGSFVAGGSANWSSGCYSSVLGGTSNISLGYNSTVVGGMCNASHGDNASVLGGAYNLACAWNSSIVGGIENLVNGDYSVVVSGSCNVTIGESASVLGGITNTADGRSSVIAGGECNQTNALASFVAGGFENIASACYASVVGGCSGVANACYSTSIGGGITGSASCSDTALGSVAIGKGAVTVRNYEVALGSSEAPVSVGGNMTVIGTNTVTDGTTTKSWSDILNAGGSSGGSISYVGVNSTGNENKDGSGASGTDAIAIGNGAVASGNQSVSIGTGNQVRGNHSGAIGDPNIVDGSDSYVVGNNSTVRANVRNAFVLGNNTTVDNGLPDNWDSMSDEEKAAWANGLASTDIMEGAVALGSNISVSLDNKAAISRTSSGDPAIKHVVALGDNVVIGEENAVGIGHMATATALNALAIGDDAQAVAEGANAVGHSSRATNRFANAFGYQAQATGEGAGAFGQDAQATANFATAFGRSTRASAESATAIGNTAHAVTQSSIAIGSSAVANGGANTNAVAIGRGAAVGSDTQGYGEAVALGSGSSVQNAYGTALGSGASVTGQNSVALGYGSTAAQSYVVSVGKDAVTGDTPVAEVTRRIVHVADGVNDTDAVNVSQLNDGLYDKANWDASNIGRNLSVADDEYPEGLTDEQKAEALANIREYNLRSWGQALGAGTVTGGDSRLVTGDTLHVEVRPAENGTYVKTNNTTGQNLLALDQQLSTVLEGTASQNTAISDLQNEMDTKANVGLDNITDAGKTVVRDLAKESVKVVNGTNTIVTEGTDGNAKTYEVNAVTDGAVADGNTGIVTGGTVYSAIQDMIASSGSSEGKANVALDNVTEAGHAVIKTDAKSAVNVAGNSDVTVTKTDVDGVDTYNIAVVKTGTVSDGNEGIVTGDTVYDALKAETRLSADGNYITTGNTAGANLTALDAQVKTNTDAVAAHTTDITNLKDLSNITDAGQTVVQNLAKGSVNVVGSDKATVTKTDVNGVDTYTVSVKNDGLVASGNAGLVSGGTIYDALVAETRPVANGNYITTDRTAGANLTALDTQVKANADAIAAHTTDITNLKDLSNITDAGQTVVQNLAKGSVNVVGANKATVTKTDVNGVDTYTVDVKVDGEILAGNKGLIDGGTVFDAVAAATGNIIDYTDDGLAGKANVDLDNVTEAGHTVIKADAKSAVNVAGGTNAEVVKTDVNGVDTYTVNVAGNGQVVENNTGLMSGATMYDELRPADGNYIRKDATTAVNLSALDTMIGSVADGTYVRSANTVGQNLNALDEVLYDKANGDASNIGRNLSIAGRDYPDGLTDEQKAEYASNLREYNLRSWGQALGAGTVTGGDARLVTGDTLHVEVRPANSGTYVRVDKTTGENLLALDEQLSSVVNGSSAQSTAISDLENEMANKANIALDNINADGVNVVRNIAKSAVVVADGSNTTVSSSTDTDGNITYRVTANATGSVADGNTGLVDGGMVYTAIENAKGSMGGDIGGLDADGNYIRKANTVAQNLVALDTQVKTNADGLAAEQMARETADTALSNRIGTLTADGNYIAKDSSVSENLSRLDTAVKTVGDTVDANAAAIADLKDLSNITAAGETVIKDLAKGSVKVINGTNTTVIEGMDGDVKTFAVNVASNGAVADGDTGLVSGGTVKSALDALSGSVDAGLAGKANVSLDNLDADGHSVIKSDAKSALNVTGGQYATVTKTDVDGVDTYTVNVATDGSVMDGNEKLVTGGTVYDALQDIRGSVDTAMAGKANTSLDNLDVAGVGRVRDIAKTAVSVANGAYTKALSEIDADGNVTYRVNVDLDGSVASGNNGIVSGGGIYNELRPADGNYVAQSNSTAANLTALDVAVKEAMTKAETVQAAAGGNVVLYDGDDKSAVTLGGTDGTVIHNVADGAVSADSKDAVNGGQLYTVKSAVDVNTTAIAGLDTKIQDHATAIAGLDMRVQDNATAIAGLDTRVQDNATAIAGLDTRVQDNATAIDTLRTTVTDGLNGKADTDLGNLSDTGKETVRGLAKESVRVADGVNTTVRTTVEGNASVYHVDVATTGRVEFGNVGIVTGDAVYEALRDLELNASDTHYVSVNPSERDDETYTNHGASGVDAVAIGAKSYARGDESVAIGHNNDVSGNETYVIGSDVNATGNHSVVLGKGSDGSLDNVVSVGSAGNERRIVHVADGELSADSKDAVNGKQLYEVREKLQNAEGIDVDKWSDALGTGSVAPGDDRLVKGSTVYSAIQSFSGISLSPDGSTLHVGTNNTATVVDFSNSEGNGRVLQGVVTDPDNPNSAANVGYVNAVGQNIINGVNNSLNRMDTRIDKVGAGAAALASLEPMPFDDDQKWSISAAIGTYHGTQAGAVGVFYKPQDNLMLNIRGAVGNGENMGGAGLSIGLNKGAAKGLSKASMAKAMNAQANEIVAQKQLIQNQQAQLDAQKAEIEELKQMVRSVVASKQAAK